jgi:ATP-dependent helicase/nuclease subunit B
VGYQSRNGILPAPKRGHTRDLDAERNDWRAVLQRLAEDFHGGRAIASPKHYPDTCRYCLQRTLCRLEIAPADAFNSDGEEIEVTASASSIARTDSQP